MRFKIRLAKAALFFSTLGIFATIPLTASAACVRPTSEVTYATCPLSGLTEIIVTNAPFCAGGGVNGSSDDTYAIQNALNAGLACRLPVYFPAGYYYVSKSILLNGHPANSTQWQEGALVHGAGLLSIITGTLTQSYPVIDATGYNYGKIQDLSVIAAGQATTALLLGVPGTSGTSGGTVTLDRASFGGGTIAAAINLGSDLMRVVGCSFNGPTGLIISAANFLGVKSQFNSPLVADSANAYQNGTIARVTDSNFGATTGSDIWIDGMDSVSLSSNYFHVGGSGTSGIKVTAQKTSTGYVARGDSLYVFNSRLEVSTTAPASYFLDLSPGVNTQKGTITGVPQVTGLGAYIHLPAGSGMDGYDLNFSTDNAFPLIDGDIVGGVHQVGAQTNSVINAPGVTGYLGAGSSANTLIAYYGKYWSYPAGAFNSIVSGNLSFMGTPIQVAGEISPSETNTYSLGDASHRFTSVYATNGVIQTSDMRQKKDITNSDLGLEFINNLRPVSYRWKSGPDADLHYGLIAQETEKVVNKYIAKTSRKPASSEQIIVSHDSKTGDYGLKYSELISPMIKAIQELYNTQDRELASVKTENVAKDKEIEKLKQENLAVKSYLCGKDPTAPFCK